MRFLVGLAAPSSSVVALLCLVACRSSSDAAPPRPSAVGDVDRSPAKKPPPLRAAHPVLPKLPDLPALSAHEASEPAPADPDANDHPCRSVWTGSYTAPLTCARALLFGAPRDGGAVPLVPRKLLARDPDLVPAISDHRLEGTEGIVRDQGNAPACSAFATAAALDHALLRWGGSKRDPVSVMQIWSRYHSPHVETSLVSNLGQRLAPERAWPFSASEALSWVPCTDFARPPRGGCGVPVDMARLARAEANPIGEFTEVEYLAMPADVSVLRAKIAAGQDIIVGMELPQAFVPKGNPGARYVPQYARSAGADAGHAVVLAGYARLPHGTYFLAHNSWGPGWGDGGYAWLHETTLAQWAREMVAVDAEPVERAEGSRPARVRGSTTCYAGLVPDSIRGTCAPPCPDRSPRHDGVCAVDGQCPIGYVNLTGACVLAAPTASGQDPSTHIAWACGPGGCAYSLPRTSDPACSGDLCAASCPAPDFHIARMGSALVCIE